MQQNIVPRPRTGEYLGGAGGLAGTGGFSCRLPFETAPQDADRNRWRHECPEDN